MHCDRFIARFNFRNKSNNVDSVENQFTFQIFWNSLNVAILSPNPVFIYLEMNPIENNRIL